MTVSTIYEPIVYDGNGSLNSFPITFNYLGVVNNVKVSIRNTSTNVLTTKSYGTHYTISGSNVVFTSGNIPTSSNKIVIELYLNLLQESDYIENSSMSAENLEDDLDKLTLEVQMLADSVERTVRVGPDIDIDTLTPTEILESTYEIGTPGTTGQVISTDADGDLVWVDNGESQWSGYDIPTDGTAGQVLTTNGSGGLSWSTVSGGSEDSLVKAACTILWNSGLAQFYVSSAVNVASVSQPSPGVFVVTYTDSIGHPIPIVSTLGSFSYDANAITAYNNTGSSIYINTKVNASGTWVSQGVEFSLVVIGYT